MSYPRNAIHDLRDLHQRLHLTVDAPPDQVMAAHQQLIDVLAPLGLDRARVPPVDPHALANTAPMTLLVWGDDHAERLAAYVIPNDQITAAQHAALEGGAVDQLGAALDGPWQVFYVDDLAAPTASPEWIDRRFTAAYAFSPGA